MDIRTLRYFVEVVRQQSFTRAAEKLFVTQPTISKMMKNLEDELNCTLLIRDGRKLLLTDTGRVVFERGLAILAEFRQLEAERIEATKTLILSRHFDQLPRGTQGEMGLIRGEIARRRAAWTAPAPRYTRGVQAKFAFNAASASKGAVLDNY